MEEGKTGLTTLTTNTGDLAKNNNNSLEYAWQLHERASVKMENYLCLVLNCFLLRCEIDVVGGKIGDKSVSAGPQSESY